ncbi:uncharacterized protein LACBIDRAFT_328614 [Laccaria bicolor S238N-H82]|uniref:Predicted protein n=1 Tax=Laccaria bicolor (strain S238N-H82 / ATCC MYA-4686) TaxID=486041 RepID=B0DFF3_LACBS|nr:uncharacterized protein LACBIDRAFT_328614 [Laccaria bicolor S238N-H82]EDR06694.1 predicted protein [Laccaria bicolor S238N-H82]|eukprot:XP_001882541.1 predicted protein [Laccaria bicolor S238N-H82]
MPNLNPTLIHTFIALQLSGPSIFLLILATALLCKTRINRHPVWYNFCVSWVIFGVSFSLLTLCGEQFKFEPRKRVCFIQAGLVYAAPFLCVCSMFLFTFLPKVTMRSYLLLSVLSVLSSSPTKKRYPKIIAFVEARSFLHQASFFGEFIIVSVHLATQGIDSTLAQRDLLRFEAPHCGADFYVGWYRFHCFDVVLATRPGSASSGTSFEWITTAFLRTISIRRQVSGSRGSVPLPAELESSRSTANLTLSGDSDEEDLEL